MQIYGILLRFRGIFTENAWKITENMRKIVEFPRNSFHNLFPDDPFSRSFPVVFARNSLVFPVIFRLIPIDSSKSFLFIPFRSSTPIFSSPNVKSYLIIRFFVVNIWVIRKFVVSLHCLKEIMI